MRKEEARRLVYERLKKAGAARFPFPIDGRIPNFKGAEAAAERLRSLPAYQKARALKINPDAPQLPVRANALWDGKTVYMPSPRLRGAFIRLDPALIPPQARRKAASLSGCRRYGVEVGLADLAAGRIDLIVAGSVAVTPEGARAGKGEGYSDREYGILRELGHPPVPVVTTVHELQIVDELEMNPHDLSLDAIITPERVIETGSPFPKPYGIDWTLVTPEDLRAMPVLEELRRMRGSGGPGAART